jgi:hypothetical protein
VPRKSGRLGDVAGSVMVYVIIYVSHRVGLRIYNLGSIRSWRDLSLEQVVASFFALCSKLYANFSFCLFLAPETAFFTLRSFLRLPSNQAHQAHQSSLTN